MDSHLYSVCSQSVKKWFRKRMFVGQGDHLPGILLLNAAGLCFLCFQDDFEELQEDVHFRLLLVDCCTDVSSDIIQVTFY